MGYILPIGTIPLQSNHLRAETPLVGNVKQITPTPPYKNQRQKTQYMGNVSHQQDGDELHVATRRCEDSLASASPFDILSQKKLKGHFFDETV
ncbi:hypothetical protein [Bacillus fonticola]|uniref:hypothetical protein n=1 Tax=Bacillus fonticola TaxID=2728853 RepID=UPI0014745B8E|nr:hypothetical protein [Bacillus fonticola]